MPGNVGNQLTCQLRSEADLAVVAHIFLCKDQAENVELYCIKDLVSRFIWNSSMAGPSQATGEGGAAGMNLPAPHLEKIKGIIKIC